MGTARGWGDRGRQVGNRRVAPQEGHRVELTRCKKSGKEERAPNSGRQRCLVSKIAVSCHQEWEGTSRVTLCSRAQGLEGTPSWGPIHQGSPAPYTGTVGTGAQGLGNLEKLLPAHPWYGGLSVQHQCGPSCRDLWQLGQEGTRDTAPVKKGKPDAALGNFRLMLGVGIKSSVKEKHPRVERAQFPTARRARSPPGSVGHPRPPLAGLGAPKGAVSLTPCTALTRSLTRGRDLRPGLMSGMLLMQRRNFTAAPLPQGRPSQATGKKTENTSHVRGSWGAGQRWRSPWSAAGAKLAAVGGCLGREEPHQIAN